MNQATCAVTVSTPLDSMEGLLGGLKESGPAVCDSHPPGRSWRRELGSLGIGFRQITRQVSMSPRQQSIL